VRIRLAVLALSAWLAGCSSLASGPDASGPGAGERSAVASFSVRWRESISGMGFLEGWSTSPLGNPGLVRWRMRGDYSDMGNSVLRPAAMGGSLYVASAKGIIVRVDAATGARQWHVQTGITLTGGVTAEEGLIVVGGEKGDVLAYGEDGKLRWKAVATSEVLGPPEVSGGVVVVRGGDGSIAGLDAADGKRKWLYEHALPALVVRGSAGVAVRQGTLYAGFAGGKLVALDVATGAVKWEATLSEPRGTTELERISDITSTPQVDDHEVCAVSYQGRVGCFNLADGNLVWSREFSGDKGLALSEKNLYVVSMEGEVLALDKSTGSSAWKNSQLDKNHTAAPAVLGAYIVVGDKKGVLYAIRREDGSIAARMTTDGSPILAAPLKVDDGLVVQTYSGGLYSVSLH
jgi:outer membrane protein assembly factor BamB